MPKSTAGSKSSKTPPGSSNPARAGGGGGRKKQPRPAKAKGPRAAPAGWSGIAAALALAAFSAFVALWWFHRHGYLLHYGDAVAHLNIARRLFDSRTPGYEQIGTVWLPLPHWIMSWFARDDGWWRTGLAGGIPAALCQTLAATFLFAAVRRAFSSTAAALVALLLFLWNPNSAYLGSIPMTEPFFALAFAALCYFTVAGSAVGAGLAACAGSLIRYDAWFVIPFVAARFLWSHGPRPALLFSVLAGAGPLYWFGHNAVYYGDPLEFYWGPWSAKAINQRAVDAGMARYPGDHNWWAALRQLRAAAWLDAGAPLAWLGLIGFLAILAVKRAWVLAGLLTLPVFFYWLSIYSSGTPIFVPHLYPHSYYNTRYGLAALPLFAVGAAALVAIAPGRLRAFAAITVMAASLSPWILYPRMETWVTWKESQVNSEARRAWTGEAAEFLRANYRGGGILASFGDQTGIFQQAGIPLVTTVHDGNSALFFAQVYGRPEHFLHARWIVALGGDAVSNAVRRARLRGPRYEVVKTIAVPNAPVVEIHRLVERFPRAALRP